MDTAIVLTAILESGFDYGAQRAPSQWRSDCPNCGLKSGLLIREPEVAEQRDVELICGASCSQQRIERALSRYIPEEPRTPTFSLGDGNELAALRSISSAFYVAHLTGRKAKFGRVRCPRHAEGRERYPALRVNEDDSGWYCYACNVGGGILEFYAFAHGVAVPTEKRLFAAFVEDVRRAMEAPSG